MKSRDEELCRSRFDEFIRAFLKYKSIVWEEVAQRNEPPDYYLHLDGTGFAVEVTILMEQLEVGKLWLPQVAVLSSLWRLVDEVEATAIEKKCLNGAYLVVFSRPIANFRQVREQLFTDLLKYVQTTQNVTAAPESTILKHGRQKCTIRKLHNNKNYIAKAGPSGGKWEGEAAREICLLLENRISDKYHKLRNISKPKILLLYDSYHFANSEMFADCLLAVKHLEFFHTVFIVSSSKPGWILHSTEQDWLDQ